STIAVYHYDGQHRRAIKEQYSSEVVSETRHLYYSAGWQVLEERLEAATAERQFIWGLRYVDNLVVRDRDGDGGGTLTERLFALQDANWNVTALADETGAVVERYATDAYGLVIPMTPAFGARAVSAFDWETRYAGYRWDEESGLYHVRRRYYHPVL